jgi:hypothetical protein
LTDILTNQPESNQNSNSVVGFNKGRKITHQMFVAIRDSPAVTRDHIDRIRKNHGFTEGIISDGNGM